MKKIINDPARYTDDMLEGIYRAHGDIVHYIGDDPHCYCVKKKTVGKVAIITGGGTGHLPLFLGYVGENLIDGCAVGNVFQSPSAEQIAKLTKELDTGAGVLYLYGNYTGDIMNFDMAGEMCEMDGLRTLSIVGADDVTSNNNPDARRGIAGIFFMYKCAGAVAAQRGSLDDVLAAAQKAKDVTRTVGFALSPCIIPEVGHPNFTLKEGEMAMGMGIHGEPGVWNGSIKTADELAQESIETILNDMPIAQGGEVALLVNGLGATSLEELYILSNSVGKILDKKKIRIYRTFVGEFATSMEMAGASISIMQVDATTKAYLDLPVKTPFYCQK
jgi:dihydroxyacetone kinase-like protein